VSVEIEKVHHGVCGFPKSKELQPM